MLPTIKEIKEAYNKLGIEVTSKKFYDKKNNCCCPLTVLCLVNNNLTLNDLGDYSLTTGTLIMDWAMEQYNMLFPKGFVNGFMPKTPNMYQHNKEFTEGFDLGQLCYKELLSEKG